MKKIKKVLLIVFLALFLIVFIQNATFNGESIFGAVNFRFLLWTKEVPIIILLIGASIVGYLAGVVQMFFKRRRQERLIELEKEVSENQEK